MYDFNIVVDTVKKIAAEAGKYLIEKSSDDISVMEKSSHRDLVTNLDIRVQEFIINQLKEEFDGAGFISEETSNDDKAPFSELVFIIDPIDGTSNFIKSMNYSCVSIGCFSNGVPMAGVVYNPYADEMFSAVKGKGAYLNDKAISVTDGHISESLVIFGTAPYDIDTTDDTFDKVKKIYTKCLDIRRFGSAALDICNVACGRAGLYFEGRLSLWDYAAAAVILTEAGGTICNYSGKPLDYFSGKTSVVAGNRLIIDESGLLEG